MYLFVLYDNADETGGSRYKWPGPGGPVGGPGPCYVACLSFSVVSLYVDCTDKPLKTKPN